MNIKEFSNVDSDFRKHQSGTRISHEEMYTKVVQSIGLESLEQFLPAPKNELREALAEDESMNTIPLDEWDRCHAHVRKLLRMVGVTSCSRSQAVCILKQAARMKVTGEVLSSPRMKDRMEEIALFFQHILRYAGQNPSDKVFTMMIGDRKIELVNHKLETVLSRAVTTMDMCIDVAGKQTTYRTHNVLFRVTDDDGYDMKGALLYEIVQILQTQLDVHHIND